MVGLDLLDDAEDGEGDGLTAALGSARALNVSTGLLCLGQRALLHSAGGAEAVGVLLQATARACAGQHADLDTGRPATALDEALTIAAEKSGSLTAAACRIGALAAGVAPARQEAYARFGTYLGLVAQLLNDIAATHPDAIDKTDIALARPTLPLAYGGQQSPSGSAATVAGGPWGEGAYFAWAVADAYRRRALALIPDLADTSGGRADLAALLPQC
jgi:competence protein ComQ